LIRNWAPQETEAQRRINKAFLEARYVLAGYRVDDGFGLDLSVGFDPKGAHSQAVLKAVTGSGRTSNLTGLPDSERLVGAFSAVGLERGDLHLARVLAGDLWFGLRGSSPILDSDGVVVRRLLGDLYSRLRVGRMAVYQSGDPRLGQLAVVAVLEPNDPAQFLTELAQYARLGDVEQFDPKVEASKAEIEKLIADLGSDDFETREAATTKLGLIGDATLPYLEKAEKSEDAEVRRRAGDLRKTLQGVAELRKKELAEGLAKKAFRPTFTLKRNAEKRADANVHLMGMRLGEDAPYGAGAEGPVRSRMEPAARGRGRQAGDHPARLGPGAVRPGHRERARGQAGPGEVGVAGRLPQAGGAGTAHRAAPGPEPGAGAGHAGRGAAEGV